LGSCQGRPVGAFILTLDSSPSHFIIELGTKRNAVQLSFVHWWTGFLFLESREHHAPPRRLRGLRPEALRQLELAHLATEGLRRIVSLDLILDVDKGAWSTPKRRTKAISFSPVTECRYQCQEIANAYAIGATWGICWRVVGQ
jgi:hypothetical protein